MFWGIVLAVLAALGFSCSAIIAKLAFKDGFSPGLLLQLRFGLAVPFFIIFLLFKDRSLLIPSWPLIYKALLLGGVIYGLQSSFYYRGLTHIPASTAALILYFYPVVVAVLARLFFKQRIKPSSALSLALVVGGCCLVFVDAFQRELEITGLLYAAGAMLTYSFYMNLVQIAVRGERPLQLSFFVVVFAAITFNLLNGPAEFLKIDAAGLLYGGSLALICTVFSVACIYGAIERLGSANAAIFSTLEPVAVVTLSYLVLGEHVVVWQVLGTVFIVAGMIITNLALRGKRGHKA